MWILTFRRSIIGFHFVSAKAVNGPAVEGKDAPEYVREFVGSCPGGPGGRGAFVRTPTAGGAPGPWWYLARIAGERYEFKTLQIVINPDSEKPKGGKGKP